MGLKLAFTQVSRQSLFRSLKFAFLNRCNGFAGTLAKRFGGQGFEQK